MYFLLLKRYIDGNFSKKVWEVISVIYTLWFDFHSVEICKFFPHDFFEKIPSN